MGWNLAQGYQDLQNGVDDLTGQKHTDNDPSGNNPLAAAWNLATSGYKGVLNFTNADGLKQVGKQWGILPKDGTPDQATPSTAAPTLADANTTAINQQLSNERRAANASSILTGGSGLLDQPNVQSVSLHGS